MKILLVGTGQMSINYAKVLCALNKDFIVLGRNTLSAKKFRDLFPNVPMITELKELKKINCEFAIIAIDILHLLTYAKKMVELGIRNILIEKPGSIFLSELKDFECITMDFDINIRIAYNRRFYRSVQECKKQVQLDNNIVNVNFEFNEKLSEIDNLPIDDKIKQKWMIANSSHVFDTVNFICGDINASTQYASHQTFLHPSGTTFVGCGKLINGGLYSYSSNWGIGGRWKIEIVTNKNRYLLHPLERLKIYNVDKLVFEDLLNENEYELDNKYKPGLFKQVEKFINYDLQDFSSISDQIKLLKKMSEIEKC
jgi:hypothetical protein